MVVFIFPLFLLFINTSDVAATTKKAKAGGKVRHDTNSGSTTVTETSANGFQQNITGKVKAYAKADGNIGRDPQKNWRPGNKVIITTHPPPPNNGGCSGVGATFGAATAAQSPAQGAWRARASAEVSLSGNPTNRQRMIGLMTIHWVPSASITSQYSVTAEAQSGHNSKAVVNFKDPMVLYVASGDTFEIALVLENGFHFQGIAGCSLQAISDFPDLSGLAYRLVIESSDYSFNVDFWSNPALGLSDPYIENIVVGAFTFEPNSATYVLNSDLKVFQSSFTVPEGVDSISCEWDGSSFAIVAPGTSTLTQWGLLLLILAMAGFSVYVLMRRRKVSAV